jgi:hypothetical protein
VVGSFQNLEGAEAARKSLLAKGIDRDSIELQVIADEAGATEGNFASGNGKSVGDSPLSIGGVGQYGDNFANPTFSGTCLLLVFTADETQRRLVLEELGPNIRTDPAQR